MDGQAARAAGGKVQSAPAQLGTRRCPTDSRRTSSPHPHRAGGLYRSLGGPRRAPPTLTAREWRPPLFVLTSPRATRGTVPPTESHHLRPPAPHPWPAPRQETAQPRLQPPEFPGQFSVTSFWRKRPERQESWTEPRPRARTRTWPWTWTWAAWRQRSIRGQLLQLRQARSPRPGLPRASPWKQRPTSQWQSPPRARQPTPAVRPCCLEQACQRAATPIPWTARDAASAQTIRLHACRGLAGQL